MEVWSRILGEDYDIDYYIKTKERLSMFDFIMVGIKKEYAHIRNEISTISQNLIGGIGAILSLLTFVSAIVCFVVLIVRFVSAGGYENVFSDVFSFRGNAGSFYGMPYLAILGGFNIALLLISYILFFKNEKWGLRILGLMPFVVVFGCYLTYFIMMQMYKLGKLESTDETRKIVYGLMTAGFVAAVISLMILLIREKVMSRSCLRMLILSFVVLPLLTFCIENIVILGILAVGCIIIRVFFLSGSVPDGGKENYAQSRQTVTEAPKQTSGLTKEQQQAIYDINRKYKDGCAAIVKANGENGAFMFSDRTNQEIAKLRKELEKEAELKGVKGKVSIY
jgi:hypothetical protein